MAPRQALAGTLVLVALQVAHLALREQTWRIDVGWAVFQYLFSMVFYGPVVAGFACWQGRHFHDAAWMARSRPERSVWLHLSAVLGIAVGVFGAGVVVAVVLAVLTGAPVDPVAQVPALVAAVVGIAGYAAVGLWVGLVWPSRLAAPVVAVAAFALTIAAYVAGFEGVIRFGGATAGLIADRLSHGVAAWRIGFWLAVTAFAVGAALGRLTGWSSGRGVARVAAAGVAVSFVALSASDDIFTEVPVEWSCGGDGVEVCVPSTQERFLEDVSRLAAENEVVALFARQPTSRLPWNVDIPLLLARMPGVRAGDEEDLSDARRTMTLTAMSIISDGCYNGGDRLDDASYTWTPERDEAQTEILNWLWTLAYSDRGAELPDPLRVPGDPTDPATQAWVAERAAVLGECPGR